MSKLFFGAAVVVLVLVLTYGFDPVLKVAPPLQPIELVSQQAPTPVHPAEVHTVSRAAVLNTIRSRALLVTTDYRGTAVVEEKRDGVLLGLIDGESFKVIAVGEVQSGIDLSQLTDDSIEVNGTSAIVHLPAPIVVSESLDEENTFIAGHTLSWFSKSDSALAEEGRRQALKEIHQKACEADLVNRTTRDASLAIGALIKQFEFTSAQIYVAKDSTMCSS